jgi:hypothetical protein
MVGIGTAIAGVAGGLGVLGSAKLQSGAAGRGARLQTEAATRAAELQSQTAADQLAYVKNEARMDRESARWADRQQYGLSRAEGMNAFNRFGDTSFNRRAELVSAGLSDDKRYGDTQRSLNTMRELMGMPNKSLVSYVRPDALRLTAPSLPEYVEDPTQYTVDDPTQYAANDVVVAPTTTVRSRRLHQEPDLPMFQI